MTEIIIWKCNSCLQNIVWSFVTFNCDKMKEREWIFSQHHMRNLFSRKRKLFLKIGKYQAYFWSVKANTPGEFCVNVPENVTKCMSSKTQKYKDPQWKRGFYTFLLIWCRKRLENWSIHWVFILLLGNIKRKKKNPLCPLGGSTHLTTTFPNFLPTSFTTCFKITFSFLISRQQKKNKN